MAIPLSKINFRRCSQRRWWVFWNWTVQNSLSFVAQLFWNSQQSVHSKWINKIRVVIFKYWRQIIGRTTTNSSYNRWKQNFSSCRCRKRKNTYDFSKSKISLRSKKNKPKWNSFDFVYKKIRRGNDRANTKQTEHSCCCHNFSQTWAWYYKKCRRQKTWSCGRKCPHAIHSQFLWKRDCKSSRDCKGTYRIFCILSWNSRGYGKTQFSWRIIRRRKKRRSWNLKIKIWQGKIYPWNRSRKSKSI